MSKKKKKLPKPRLGAPTNLRPAGVHKDQKKKYKRLTEEEVDKLFNDLENSGLV